MGGTASAVREYDSGELAAKSAEAKCAKCVGEIITEHDVEGGMAYELKQAQAEEPEEFKETLAELTPSKVKQTGVKSALKKLPEESKEAARAPATDTPPAVEARARQGSGRNGEAGWTDVARGPRVRAPQLLERAMAG